MEVTKRLRHQTEITLCALGVWAWGILRANTLRQATYMHAWVYIQYNHNHKF